MFSFSFHSDDAVFLPLINASICVYVCVLGGWGWGVERGWQGGSRFSLQFTTLVSSIILLINATFMGEREGAGGGGGGGGGGLG